MLLELKNTTQDNIDKLLSFARDNDIELSLLDDDDNYHLPGKPLTEQQLENLAEKSRKSGSIEISLAHAIIRDRLNAH